MSSPRPLLVTPDKEKNVLVDQGQMSLNIHGNGIVDEEFEHHEINVNPSQVIWYNAPHLWLGLPGIPPFQNSSNIQRILFSSKHLTNSIHDDVHHPVNVSSLCKDIAKHDDANWYAGLKSSSGVESQTIELVETVEKQSRRADAFVMVPGVVALDHNNIPSVSSTLVYRQPLILGAKLKYFILFYALRSSVVSPKLREPQHSVRLL